MREALNFESGLNDGICVPIVVLLLGLAVGTQIEHGTMIHAVRVVVEEIGIGLVVGLVLTWLTTLMLRFAEGTGLDQRALGGSSDRGAGGGCFAAAQAVGGSGFIACFVGGLLLSGLRRRTRRSCCAARAAPAKRWRC